MQYALATAALVPGDPADALEVGSVARRLRRLHEASTWFNHAMGLARHLRDWPTYAATWLELGRVQVGLGDIERAEKSLLQARRAAKRHGVSFVRGAVEHDLLRMEMERGNYAEAGIHARAALRHIRTHDRDRPALLHDCARLTLLSGGDPVTALDTLSAALPQRASLADRIDTLVLMVSAAGRANEQAKVEESWYEAVGCIETLGDSVDAARRLLDLARVAAELLEELRADQMAERALMMAERVGDEALVSECRSFLKRVRLPPQEVVRAEPPHEKP